MRKFVALIGAAVLCHCLSGCSENGKDEPVVPPVDIELGEDEKTMIEACNTQALHNFEKIYRAHENVVFSPFSGNTAFAVTANLVPEELDGLQAAQVQTANKLYRKLVEGFAATDAGGIVSAPVSIWSSMHLPDAVVLDVCEDYGADYFETEAGNEAKTASEMNDWMGKATAGSLAGEIRAEDVAPLMVMTAFCFENSIAGNKIGEGKDTYFNSDNTSCSHQFFKYESEIARAWLSTGNKVIDMPIGNGAYRMSFIMAGQDRDLKDGVNSLATEWHTVLSQLNKSGNTMCTVALPTFSACSHFDYAEMLGLDGIALPIGCSISFDKKLIADGMGTMRRSRSAELPDPEELICVNGPFAYIIREASTGMILFMGTVNRL